MRRYYQTVNSSQYRLVDYPLVKQTLPMTQNDTPVVACRRRRLKLWIDTEHSGVQASFVAATGVNQGELSGLLRSKSFGEKRARSLEIAARMPVGYLDADEGHVPASDPADTALAKRLLALATPRSQRALERIIAAAEAGRLSEADVKLLGEIAARLERA